MAIGLALTAGSMTLQGAMQYAQARQQNKLNKRQNKEAREAGDREQALNTVNMNRAKEAALASEIDINTARMQARSEAIVSAAAAGTAGMSVDDSILDIERNAARAEFNVNQQLKDTIFGLEENRESIEAQVRSRSILTSGPSAALSMFNTALGIADASYGKSWDENSFSSRFGGTE